MTNAAPPIQRPPSLIDHLLALRREVAEMRQELAGMRQQAIAAAEVTDAIGNAVGQMYGYLYEQSQVQATTEEELKRKYQDDEDF